MSKSFLERIEELTGLRRQYIEIGLACLMCIYLIFGDGARLVSNSIGFVYPAYASVVAIQSKDNRDHTKWLTYWLVFAYLNVMEFFSEIILYWCPFYWLAKSFFLIWCFIPHSMNGSVYIYTYFIRPLFLKYGPKIDSVFEQFSGTINNLTNHALLEVKKGVNVENLINDHLNLINDHISQKTHNPQSKTTHME